MRQPTRLGSIGTRANRTMKARMRTFSALVYSIHVVEIVVAVAATAAAGVVVSAAALAWTTVVP